MMVNSPKISHGVMGSPKKKYIQIIDKGGDKKISIPKLDGFELVSIAFCQRMYEKPISKQAKKII